MCKYLKMADYQDSILISILTHGAQYKTASILQTAFSNAFSWMKISLFDSNFTEVPKDLFGKEPLLVVDNDLTLKWNQAFIWTVNGIVHWCIHTPFSLEELTHWGRDKMDAISQTTFSNAFSWMKMFEYRLKFHWNLFLRIQLTIFQHWFR